MSETKPLGQLVLICHTIVTNMSTFSEYPQNKNGMFVFSSNSWLQRRPCARTISSALVSVVPIGISASRRSRTSASLPLRIAGLFLDAEVDLQPVMVVATIAVRSTNKRMSSLPMVEIAERPKKVRSMPIYLSAGVMPIYSTFLWTFL